MGFVISFFSMQGLCVFLVITFGVSNLKQHQPLLKSCKYINVINISIHHAYTFFQRIHCNQCNSSKANSIEQSFVTS